MLSLNRLLHYFRNISLVIIGLYVLAPTYQTLTRSISSDSIWAVTVSLLILHLLLRDYSESTMKAPGTLKNASLTSCISVNASVVASVFIASRLPSRLHVFAILLFSLQVFLFDPLVTYCIKSYSFHLHLCFSISLMAMTLGFMYMLHCSFLFCCLVCCYLSMWSALTGLLGFRNTNLKSMGLGTRLSFVLILQTEIRLDLWRWMRNCGTRFCCL